MLIAFFLGVLVTFTYQHLFFNRDPAVASALRQSDLNPRETYKFIDPIIGLKGRGQESAVEYIALRQSITSFITSEIQNNNLKTASVYVRDITKGVNFQINPDEKYSPASLLKVPVMIAYFKLAEADPSILVKQIVYTGTQDLNLIKDIPSSVQLVKGHSYSVEELIEHMIKYSDNNADNLLVENLSAIGHGDFVKTIFKDLAIPDIEIVKDFITMQQYALFFRVLYNSTYLSREGSERALEFLTESDFSKGIDAGVPNNIIIAQKFGEFSLESPSGEVLRRELHNCGIVYYPKHPYLMCVMTKGSDFRSLEDVIQHISSLIFQYIEDAYPREAQTGT